MAGGYIYVGSAFGRGGLRGRLKHHLAPVSKPHWHIDYLRKSAQCHEIWYLASDSIYEHTWAKTLVTMPNSDLPVPRFGASDCRCDTHLIYFPTLPIVADFCDYTALPIQRIQVSV